MDQRRIMSLVGGQQKARGLYHQLESMTCLILCLARLAQAMTMGAPVRHVRMRRLLSSWPLAL